MAVVANSEGLKSEKKRPAKESSDKLAPKKANARKKRTLNETDDEGYVLANEGNATIELSISVPATRRRLLLVGLVEKAAASTKVRSVTNINKAFATKAKVVDPATGREVEVAAVTTEGGILRLPGLSVTV